MMPARLAPRLRRANRASAGPWERSLGHTRNTNGLRPDSSGLDALGETIGTGRRPLGEKGPYKSFDAKARVDFDAKGKKIFDGYAPGQNFKKRTAVEMEGEIKQASQEAPEAIEQQR